MDDLENVTVERAPPAPPPDVDDVLELPRRRGKPRFSGAPETCVVVTAVVGVSRVVRGNAGLRTVVDACAVLRLESVDDVEAGVLLEGVCSCRDSEGNAGRGDGIAIGGRVRERSGRGFGLLSSVTGCCWSLVVFREAGVGEGS